MTPPDPSARKPLSLGQRLCLLIPLIAVGVIAPTACYYEDYGGGGGQVYQAVPYGTRDYSPRPQPRTNYGYGYDPYHSGYQTRSPGYNPYGYGSSQRNQDYARQVEQKAERQRDLATQRSQMANRQEESNEQRKESGNEGWKYEGRNEGRSEEGSEESKKRR